MIYVDKLGIIICIIFIKMIIIFVKMEKVVFDFIYYFICKKKF